MQKAEKIGEWKKIMAEELTDAFKNRANFYVSDYLGLKSDELNEFKRLLEPTSSTYMVVKNSIVKIALKNAGLEKLTKLINGGTGIVFAGDAPVKAVKVVSRFGKSHTALRLKGGYLDGEIIDADRLKYLASLPTKEELIAKVVFGIKSPLSGFAGVLRNTLKSLVFAIQAIKDKKGNKSS